MAISVEIPGGREPRTGEKLIFVASRINYQIKIVSADQQVVHKYESEFYLTVTQKFNVFLQFFIFGLQKREKNMFLNKQFPIGSSKQSQLTVGNMQGNVVRPCLALIQSLGFLKTRQCAVKRHWGWPLIGINIASCL